MIISLGFNVLYRILFLFFLICDFAYGQTTIINDNTKKMDDFSLEYLYVEKSNMSIDKQQKSVKPFTPHQLAPFKLF